MLESLKSEVCELNRRLPAEGLVRLTSGNVSGRDPDTNRMVIKPSGVPFDELTPDLMIVFDLDGTIVEGTLKPSSDAYTHLVVYREMAEVHGMVHTHSNYATAWAAVGRPLPCALTAMCDAFGCDIPIGGFCLIGNEQIGREIVRSIGRAPAILMRNHGVFTIGKTPHKAFVHAVTVEDTAKTLAIAEGLGTIQPIAPDKIEQAHRRYQSEYGQ